MAAEKHGAGGFDLTAHQQTWKGFTRLLQFSVVAVAITLLLMAYFLT